MLFLCFVFASSAASITLQKQIFPPGNVILGKAISQDVYSNNTVENPIQCLANDAKPATAADVQVHSFRLTNGNIKGMASRVPDLYAYIPESLHDFLRHETEFFALNNYSTIDVEFRRTSVEFLIEFNALPQGFADVILNSQSFQLTNVALMISIGSPPSTPISPPTAPLAPNEGPCDTSKVGYTLDCMLEMVKDWNRVGDPPITFCGATTANTSIASWLSSVTAAQHVSLLEGVGNASELSFKQQSSSSKWTANATIVISDWSVGFPWQLLIGYGNQSIDDVTIDVTYQTVIIDPNDATESNYHFYMQIAFASLVCFGGLVIVCALLFLACGQTKRVFDIKVWEYWKSEKALPKEVTMKIKQATTE